MHVCTQGVSQTSLHIGLCYIWIGNGVQQPCDQRKRLLACTECTTLFWPSCGDGERTTM